MADRLLVVYKTPFQRLAETALIVAMAVAAAALWQKMLPAISSSYIIVAVSVLGFILVPRLGSLRAKRQGAPVMSRDKRNRRYLSELGPIGSSGSRLSDYAAIPKPARRVINRNRRRG